MAKSASVNYSPCSIFKHSFIERNLYLNQSFVKLLDSYGIIRIDTGRLTPGAQYVVKVNTEEFAWLIHLHVNKPPVKGNCDVTPKKGNHPMVHVCIWYTFLILRSFHFSMIFQWALKSVGPIFCYEFYFITQTFNVWLLSHKVSMHHQRNVFARVSHPSLYVIIFPWKHLHVKYFNQH